MIYFAASDTGRVREQNEDFSFATDRPIGRLDNLFVVCDGMGGHNAGEFASEGAVRRMINTIRTSRRIDPYDILSDSIEAANREIHERSVDDPAKAGMGTTLVAATVRGKTLYVANVGDSRLYVHDRRGLLQVTKDHSYVEEMVRKGLLSPEEARFHRDRNKITRAVGVLDEVRIDFFDIEVSYGTQILLCSDGLTGMLLDEQIERILSTGVDVKSRGETLIRMANEKGGRDNITVVLVEID